MLFMFCVCYAFSSVHCCLVVTCWEKADLLALVCDLYCDFVSFPFCILGQVWYLIYQFLILAVFRTFFTLIVFLLSRGCLYSESLLHDAMVWAAVIVAFDLKRKK